MGNPTVINAADHGATGDGATYGTAAINRALTAVTNGRVTAVAKAIVYFRTGTYLISSPR